MTDKITEMLPPHVEPGDTLYIVDKDLRLVYSNDQWTTFASANKGEKLLDKGWNRSVLDNMSGKEKQRWTHIYRLLLEGRVPYHEENFICSSPVERRVFLLRITPKLDADGAVVWLVHHTVRIDERQDAAARVGGQLRTLEDPERLEQEYRSRVLTRKIVIPGFRTAQHLEPLDEIGGDVLWHREHPQGATDLVHADAVGHGTESGLLATRIVVLLDEIAAQAQAPSETVSALSRAMFRTTGGDRVQFATGLFFQFDAKGSQLRCANFGHHGPIFSRSGHVEVESGPPVGMLEELGPWPETNIDLAEHGTRFLVFSDGITEQFDIEGEMFGGDRLLQSFRRHLELPLDDLLAGIVEDLGMFRGSALVKDDQTLLAVDFVGHEA